MEQHVQRDGVMTQCRAVAGAGPKLAPEAQVRSVALGVRGPDAEGLRLHPESERGERQVRYILGQASWLLCRRATWAGDGSGCQVALRCEVG